MKAKRVLGIAALAIVILFSIWWARAVVTSVSDDIQPAFVNVGQTINFTVYNWNEASNQKLYVCKQSGCTSCDNVTCNPSYCWGRVMTPSASLIRLTYTTQSSDPTGILTWYFKLQNSSGKYSSCFQASATFQINHAPSAVVYITPGSPTPTNDLTCHANVTDSDASDDPFTAVCLWNGCSGACPSCTASCNGNFCTATLSHTYLANGNIIYCNMTITDEHGFAGARVKSASVNVSTINTNAPAPATNVHAADVPGDQGHVILVSWTKSTDDGAGANDVLRYEIMRSLFAGTGYANVANTSAGTSTYYDNSVQDLKTYYYMVRACDSSYCTDSSYDSAVANAQPRMEIVNITNSFLTATSNVECVGQAYDIDGETLTMSYSFSVMAFPPGGTTHTVSGNADCIFFGGNITDQYGVYHENATSECRATLNASHITKADKVICTMIASDARENSSSMRIPQPYIPVNNTPPYATNVAITPSIPNSSTVLTCNYNFNDYDGDAEDAPATKFRWYINNEGLNSYVEVPDREARTFSGLFDKDDLVKCAVLVKDSDASWMHDADYATAYSNSTAVKIIDNALPQIIDYADNSNDTMPTNVGSSVIFQATWIDYENPSDTARLFVCNDYDAQENQYNGANKSVGFGDNDQNNPKYMWFYANKTGQYAQNVAIKPFKYLQNNYWTYAPDTIVEVGDQFAGSMLRNFTLEAYYDADSSGTYGYGEPIIRERATGGTRLVYDAGLDSVVIGAAPAPGSVLSNLSKNRARYQDRDSNTNFTSADDIYWDKDNSFTISLGDYRRTIVTQAGSRKLSTPFIYDILVYEVDSIGDTDYNSSSVLIARDNDNTFTIGKYNYYVPQYNAQPRSNHYLAFKLCIDSDNDDVCDSDGNFMNDSVYLHASNATDLVYRVITPLGSGYNHPDIRINYREASTLGCSQKQFCNTTLSSSSTLSCSYTAKNSDAWQNNYLVKVCDQKGGCSIERTGSFFVNHVPSITKVNISSSKQNFTDTANLNCSAYGISDPEGNNVSLRYSWYVKRSGIFQKYDIPNNRILTNGNTLVGDEWKCEVTAIDNFGFAANKNSSSVKITNVSYSSIIPIIIAVTDNSNESHPTKVGDSVVFRVSWYDANSAQTRLYICNSSSILDNGCWDSTYNRTSFTTSNPVIATYRVRQQDGEQNYWVRICDPTGNCSNNYPLGAEKINFTANHRPNASAISVVIERIVTSTIITCNYSFADIDNDNESGSLYKWFVNHGSGFAEEPLLTTKNLTSGFSEGDTLKCSVKVSDAHGFQDIQFRNSSNQLTVTKAPPAPVLWPIPAASPVARIFVVGFANKSRLNVTAYAKQGFLTPTQNSVVTTENSTQFGSAVVLHDFAKGKKFIVVNSSKSSLFTTARYIEFSNHYRKDFIRYGIAGKSDLLDGTYRIDLSQNLTEPVPQGSFAKVFNSSKPTGWFNISLDLFNESNIVRVRSRTSTTLGAYVESNVFVDLYPPVINISSIPSITNTARPLLLFNVSDNFYLNQSTLLVTIRNNTHIHNYSTLASLYSKALKNISCVGSQTFLACALPTSLRNGSFNLSFTINDTADRATLAKTVMTIDTSAIIVTNLSAGYIDQDGKHLPSSYATTNHLIANWTRMTGIDHYEYKIQEYDGAQFLRTLVNWTSVGLKRTVNATYNLSNGNVYYFVIRAKVSAGGYTSETSGNGILYLDSTAPTCVNCVHDDGDYTNSNDTLHAYWNFTEPESNIVEYRYAVGTSCYPYAGYNNMVPVTTAYTNEVLITNMHLLNDVSYCFSVKAQNENNLWSYWFTSGNITADLSTPYNGSINYPSGFIQSSVVWVNFSQGADDVSGINRTQLYMAAVPMSNGQCNGIFDYNPVGSQVLGQKSEAVTLQSGNCYRFQFAVTDRAGNSVTYPQGVVKILKIDTTPPSLFTVSLNNNQFYTYSTTINVQWTASTDQQSGISQYKYALFDGSNQKTNYMNTTQTSASITYALEHQHSYNVKVIAYNKANGSTTEVSNSILFIDVTPPDVVRLARIENNLNSSAGYLDIDGNNHTTITVIGEQGIECIASQFDIDFTSDLSLPYVTGCSLVAGGPNVTCMINVSDGNHTRYIVCRDNNGNAQNAAQNLAVHWISDFYGPNITIVSPKQNDVVGGLITIDTSINDLGVGPDKASYVITDLNGVTQYSGTLPAPGFDSVWDTRGHSYGGFYVLFVRANDTLGHKSNKSVTFLINNGVPALAIQNPLYTKENFTVRMISQMFINVTLNITNSTRHLFFKQVNSSNSMRNYVVWSKRVNISSPSLWPEGNYTINTMANNNLSLSTVKKSSVIVDRKAPKYGFILNTSSKTYYKDSSVKLNVSWTDNFKMSQVVFSHNASHNWTNVTATAVGNYYIYTIQPSLLRNRQSIGWYSFATDMAGNRNGSMPLQHIRISNRAPVLSALANKTSNATEIVTIIATAADPDGDNLTYVINDSRFVQSANIFRWNTTITDAGFYAVNVTVTDGLLNDSQRLWITVLSVYDTDNDGIPDYKDPDSDNDSFANTVDFLNGFATSVNTTIANFNCSVGGSFNLRQLFSGLKMVNCTNTTAPLFSFEYNFSQGITLHMIRITVAKQNNGTDGWILVKGLKLPGDTRKTVYVDDLNASLSSVCVKDSDVSSVASISATCNLADEHLVPCDGGLYYNNFTCSDKGAYYEVTGLRHSAVKEQTGCTDRDGDGYGIGCASGTDYDDNDPSVHSAPVPSSGRTSGGGGGGALAQCSNGRDDDHDGLIDMADPGCSSRFDNNEADYLCVESWICTDWTECSSKGTQSRQCIDAKQCGTNYFTPIESRSCTSPVLPLAEPSCYDGIRNQGETEVDCGGLCLPCSTCVDGIQNQGETGVDCGGPCPSCTKPAAAPLQKVLKGWRGWLTLQNVLSIALAAVIIIALLLLVAPRLRRKVEPKREAPKYMDSRTEKLLRVEKIVLAQIHAGTPRQEIEQALAAKGWPASIIDKIIKLENYVRVELSRGYTYTAIKASLLRVGWPAELLDEVFRHFQEGARKL